MTQKQCALIGCPDDRGVSNNNGRPGAAGGPDKFREWFGKPKGFYPVQEAVYDVGNIQLNQNSIQASHDLAVDLLKEQTAELGTTLLIGGGHDYAYPHLKAISEWLGHNKKLGCINLDPHFDLRPNKEKILSGSPFYMALEAGLLQGKNLVELGIQRHCNGRELWEYARQQQVKVYPFDELRFGRTIDAFKKALYELSHHCDAVVISLDLDSINLAYAPGVSAPAVEGFSPSEVLEMMKLSAQSEKVVSLGIYELNPHYDWDDHTARLAVTIAHQFLENKFTFD